MPMLSPQVGCEGMNGPSSVAVRGPSLTQRRHLLNALIAEMLSLPNDGRHPKLETVPERLRSEDNGSTDQASGDARAIAAITSLWYTKRSVCALELEYRSAAEYARSARQTNADEMRLLPDLGRLFFDDERNRAERAR